MRKLLILISLLALSFTFAQNDNPDATILEGLADEEFSTLVTLLEQAGLVEALSGEGPFTVFAPINAAFEELDPAVLEQLQSDSALLEQVLLTHVVEGVYGVNDLQDAGEGEIVSLQGEPLYFDIETGGLTVNNADLDSTNVGNNYANGVVHVVGDVVVPVSLAGQFGEGDFEDEVAADADEADAEAAGAEASAEDMASDSVVATLQNDERFSTLVGLLGQAGLVETLQGEGPFTVFAPTNDAFAALPEEQLTALQDDPDMLARVLSYHVVEGNVMSADVSDGMVMTLEGSELEATTENGVMFNDATVTEPDLETGNGVVHVIDRVLLPEGIGE